MVISFSFDCIFLAVIFVDLASATVVAIHICKYRPDFEVPGRTQSMGAWTSHRYAKVRGGDRMWCRPRGAQW